MKKIYEQTPIIKSILGKQKIDKTKNYRKFFYINECPVDGGVIFFNTVTYELVFLSEDDLKLLEAPDLSNDIIRYLIEAYFLVPEDFDDKKFGISAIDTRVAIQSTYTEKPYKFFVILTTTGCNARCFYCFEQGAKVSNMTAKTAHDVADFIARKGSKKVRIQWFGGEPLVNTKAIDIISQDLKDKGVEFESTMVSNAYLLTEENIKKAVELWKLFRVQITLDGTEEVYNKVKNYVYKDVESPFKTVLQNIENALKAGIQVMVRLNMDEHNADDLFALSKVLVEKFGSYKNCYIYVVRLFEDTCAKIRNRETGDRHKLIEASVKLHNYIYENSSKPIWDDLGTSVAIPNTCMANNDCSVMVSPEGNLGKCEHYVDSNFFGNIYSDKYDLDNIRKFKVMKTLGPFCDDCNMRSLCIHLKECTGVPHHCDEIDKIAAKGRLDSKLTNIYTKFCEIEAEKEKN